MPPKARSHGWPLLLPSDPIAMSKMKAERRLSGQMWPPAARQVEWLLPGVQSVDAASAMGRERLSLPVGSNVKFRAPNSAMPTTAQGRELPFVADPPERQVSGAEFSEAYDSCGSGPDFRFSTAQRSSLTHPIRRAVCRPRVAMRPPRHHGNAYRLRRGPRLHEHRVLSRAARARPSRTRLPADAQRSISRLSISRVLPRRAAPSATSGVLAARSAGVGGSRSVRRRIAM